jgi:aminoglycoside phosphotransferase (APT) family kinase protein
MALSLEQLETIVTTALPGEQLKQVQPQPDARYTVDLASGEQVDVQAYASPAAAATAAAALQRLRGEIDLPVPTLQASDTGGELIGTPYIVHSAIHGQPLTSALPQIPEGALYELGRALGRAVYGVHRLACEQYGPLLRGEAGPATEREYVLGRVDSGLQAARQAALLSDHQANELRMHFDQQFASAGTRAALIVGRLSVERVIVRAGGERWSLAGIAGWEHATGWSPTWDHATLLEYARAPEFFALRVGYGNGYDDETPRTYEQVREAALRPYRELLALEQALDAHHAGDAAELRRNLHVLIGLTNLAQPQPPQRPSTA